MFSYYYVCSCIVIRPPFLHLGSPGIKQPDREPAGQLEGPAAQAINPLILGRDKERGL